MKIMRSLLGESVDRASIIQINSRELFAGLRNSRETRAAREIAPKLASATGEKTTTRRAHSRRRSSKESIDTVAHCSAKRLKAVQRRGLVLLIGAEH